MHASELSDSIYDATDELTVDALVVVRIGEREWEVAEVDSYNLPHTLVLKVE